MLQLRNMINSDVIFKYPKNLELCIKQVKKLKIYEKPR